MTASLRIKIINDEKDCGVGERTWEGGWILESSSSLFCYCAPPMIGLPGPSSIFNADSTLHILNFNSHSHFIILNVIE